MIPLIGYTNRLSARPGDIIDFKVSSTSDEPFEAQLIRIVCADPNPEGPGIIHHDVPSSFDGSYPSHAKDYRLGSYVRVGHGGKLTTPDSFTVVATIWPTTPGKGQQGIVNCYDETLNSGFALCIDASGAASVILGRGHGDAVTASSGQPLRSHTWARVWASFDATSGELTVGQHALSGQPPAARHSVTLDAGQVPALADPILIAALGGSAPHGHFNGKIEAPMIFGRVLSKAEVVAANPRDNGGESLACWDFSEGISTLQITDVGPNRLNGKIVNLPARAMTGSNWAAQEMCWRHAPELYGAIHFHDDDFYDCAWETDFSFTIPENLPSGVYAAKLRCGEHEDTMPFFVAPKLGTKQADLCVVIPTFTYIIYSNHARPDYGASLEDAMAAWNAYPWNPTMHPEYGLSTYNFHSDGSGICHNSCLRPMLTLRSGFITLQIPGSGSGLRHFQADTHLLAWLEHQGIEFDIVSDQELHDDGVAALAPYRAVMTTSHPEYHTPESLDTFLAYRDGGGNLAYMGGNGFYWRIALHPQAPGAVEIRRGEGGIRAWAAEPGEYYNAFDGAYGGLWRRSGRPPQLLAGIGFSGQGMFRGSYFRRTKGSADPRVSWMFAGIDDEILGDFGLSGHGAAGYELDRVDHRLGSPDDIIVVAKSENHDDTFVAVPEEHLTHVSTTTGEPPKDLIRADMSYFETPSGGAVFSTGSITFCGSLPSSNFDNNISRLLLNVLRRFLGQT